MTPIEVKSIADKHLDAWHATFAEGPPVTERSLRDYVADGIAEALTKQAAMYQAGADTLRFERDKALADAARMVAGMQETAKFHHETTAQFSAEEVATGFIHMVLTHSWDKDQMTRILEAWMVKGLKEHPDAKRIDWLESGGHAFGTKWVGSAHARMVGHATGHEAATVRQAIDAAIRQQETPAT